MSRSAGSNPAPSSMGFVYKWTNVVNGHWYVGSHVGEEDDGYVGSGIAFRLAYAKYGSKSFQREILYRGEEFKKIERQLLVEFDARNDPSSYNLINESYEGFLGLKHSDETRAKMSVNQRGTNNPMFGKSGQLSPTFGRRGCECKNSKLTQAQIDEIRKLLATHNNRQIAVMFNVSRHTISRIRRGISYGSVAERPKAPISKIGAGNTAAGSTPATSSED